MGRVCGILTQNTNFHINLINSALGNVYAYLTKYSYVILSILTQLSGICYHITFSDNTLHIQNLPHVVPIETHLFLRISEQLICLLWDCGLNSDAWTGTENVLKRQKSRQIIKDTR
jgi:hypothetical protein